MVTLMFVNTRAECLLDSCAVPGDLKGKAVLMHSFIGVETYCSHRIRFVIYKCAKRFGGEGGGVVAPSLCSHIYWTLDGKT